MNQSQVPPSNLRSLTRADERISFLYAEHCTIGRDSNALTATDESGTSYIPSAALGVLMLGPGTRVTHQAMSVIADSGSSVVWVGENGVRYYAHGRPLARSSKLLLKQVEKVSNSRSRLAVAREMYSKRFPGEDVSALTMQQLRGREGARVRASYRKYARQNGVKWEKREYDPAEYEGSDDINRALSAAHSCLYGVVHSVIVALGCSPGLGFVHTGHDRSFVYDIADLYKAELSIPVAFQTVREFSELDDLSGSQLDTMVRRNMRDSIHKTRLMSTCVADIKSLLESGGDFPDSHNEGEDMLWDGSNKSIPGGSNHESDLF